MADETVECQPWRCESCQYWGQRVPAFNTTALRTCGAPALVYGYKVADVHWDARNDLAVIENWEGWGLLTGPEFGCVHWQQREQEGDGQEAAEPPSPV